MLSFDTTHTLTGRLLQAEADADTRGWGGPPILLMLHDQPYTPPCSPNRLRRMRVVSYTLDPGDIAEHTTGLPAVLQNLADHLTNADTRACTAVPAGRGPDVGGDRGPHAGQITADMITAPPAARLLAWAVLYEDLAADPADIAEVRRVDAVDIDNRVYQLTRRRGEPHVVVLVDDHPDPGDTPATHPGLTALLTATGRLPRHDTREGARQ